MTKTIPRTWRRRSPCGGMNVIVPKTGRKAKPRRKRFVSSMTRSAVSPSSPAVKRRAARISRTMERSAERGEARGDAERQLDRHADVELRVRPAAHEMLVEEVLEVEAADERVALDATVREVAAGHARALAVLEAADAARVQRADVERGGELRADRLERQEAVLVARERRVDEDADDRANLRTALPAAVLDRQEAPGNGRARGRRPIWRGAAGRTRGAATEAPAWIRGVLRRDHVRVLLAGTRSDRSPMGKLRTLCPESCQVAWSFRRTVGFHRSKADIGHRLQHFDEGGEIRVAEPPSHGRRQALARLRGRRERHAGGLALL